MIFKKLFNKHCFESLASGTTEEWAEWHKKAREKPLCNFIANTFPTYIRVKLMQLNDVKYWFKYRLQKEHKYNIINTGLKPGYYENDERILHGMFNLLAEFVEIEKAQCYYIWGDGNNNTCPKTAGILYLSWEAQLVHDGEYMCKDEDIGKPTQQAITAEQVLELYTWWIDTRPARKEPLELVGFYDIDRRGQVGNESVMEMLAYRAQEEKEETSKAYDKADIIEKEYEDEDTEMLIKLIKIRKALWT